MGDLSPDQLTRIVAKIKYQLNVEMHLISKYKSNTIQNIPHMFLSIEDKVFLKLKKFFTSFSFKLGN